jgi:hypothetical protein
MKALTSSRALAATISLVVAAGVVTAGVAWATTATSHTFSTTLAKGTSVNISPTGLLQMFTSPNNSDESISHLGYRDGYELCDPTHKYFETGTGAGSAGFGPASTSGSGNSFKVVRTTKDNRFKFTQQFTFDPSARRVSVAMIITNLTNAPIPAIGLRRYADFDVDTFGADGYASAANLWTRTQDAVIAWRDDNGASHQNFQLPQPHGMILSGQGNPLGRDPIPSVTQTAFNTNCTPTSGAATPVVNATDKAAELYWSVGAIYPGTSVTYVAAYQRI